MRFLKTNLKWKLPKMKFFKSFPKTKLTALHLLCILLAVLLLSSLFSNYTSGAYYLTGRPNRLIYSDVLEGFREGVTGDAEINNIANDLTNKGFNQLNKAAQKPQALPPPRRNIGVPPMGVPAVANNSILKSQIVPPVCPACPKSTACPREKECPPCPAPKRCPEPDFTCKKVPNYDNVKKKQNKGNRNGGMSDMSNVVPQPVLSDFSTFGM
jgi:hypothetical protein